MRKLLPRVGEVTETESEIALVVHAMTETTEVVVASETATVGREVGVIVDMILTGVEMAIAEIIAGMTVVEGIEEVGVTVRFAPPKTLMTCLLYGWIIRAGSTVCMLRRIFQMPICCMRCGRLNLMHCLPH